MQAHQWKHQLYMLSSSCHTEFLKGKFCWPVPELGLAKCYCFVYIQLSFYYLSRIAETVLYCVYIRRRERGRESWLLITCWCQYFKNMCIRWAVKLTGLPTFWVRNQKGGNAKKMKRKENTWPDVFCIYYFYSLSPSYFDNLSLSFSLSKWQLFPSKSFGWCLTRGSWAPPLCGEKQKYRDSIFPSFFLSFLNRVRITRGSSLVFVANRSILGCCAEMLHAERKRVVTRNLCQWDSTRWTCDFCYLSTIPDDNQ